MSYNSYYKYRMTTNIGETNIWRFAKIKHLVNLANAHHQLIIYIACGVVQYQGKHAEPSIFNNLVQKYLPLDCPELWFASELHENSSTASYHVALVQI